MGTVFGEFEDCTLSRGPKPRHHQLADRFLLWMIGKVRIIFLSVAWLLEIQSAVAAYSLQVGNVLWTRSPGGYVCFTDSVYPNTVRFTITKLKPGQEDYAVAAGPSGTTGTYNRQLSSGTSRLSYQLYVDASLRNTWKAPPMATASEVISGWAPGNAGQVIPLSFILFVPAGQIVEPGRYTDHVTISVYQAYNDPAPPVDTRTITITVVVLPGSALSIVPTGGTFSPNTRHRLDLGTLSTGKSLGCDVLVRKNTSCDVMFTSVNRGVLRMADGSGDDFVPYTFVVNGNKIGLATPARITLSGGVTQSPDGVRVPVQVTVGDIENPAAGNYHDEVVVTLVVN
ncbi:MAG: spore coat U domain-containing protein [Verrucomicrobiae bacterium]|nr:spore coat U domain-containing protein [Verrucomicrobiae bacterium]